jgi:hypothetical protein
VSSKAALKVPVFTQYGTVEMADAARVRQFEDAPNAEFVVERRTGRLLRIVLTSYGDDYGRRGRHSNPQRDVHQAETDSNPPRVWTFKHSVESAKQRAGEPQS